MHDTPALARRREPSWRRAARAGRGRKSGRRWAAATPWAARATRGGTASFEGDVGRAAVEARDVGKFFDDVVVVYARRVFRRHAETAVALVERAGAFDVFVVLDEGAVKFAAGPSGAQAFAQAIRTADFHDWAAEI